MAENQENAHIVDLIDEDGNTVQFEHLDTIDMNGDKYIVCIPYDDSEEDVTEIVMFMIDKTKPEDNCLSQVMDDAVAEKVYDLFKERNSDLFDFED